MVIYIAGRFLNRSYLPDSVKNLLAGSCGECVYHITSQSGPLGAVVAAAPADEGRGVE
jgi:hypothetical protein